MTQKQKALAWDKIKHKLKNQCEGNRSMNQNVEELMQWAEREVKSERFTEAV